MLVYIARRGCALRPGLQSYVLPGLCQRRLFPLLRTFSSTPKLHNSDKDKIIAETASQDTAGKPFTENVFTIPNVLTLSRIALTPVIVYSVINQQPVLTGTLLLVGGLSDAVDGWIARKYNMGSVLGSVLDPVADKLLVGAVGSALWYTGQLPAPLVVLILSRDIALALWGLVWRIRTLPQPPTIKKFFDPTISTAVVEPTFISKVNTALQLALIGITSISPIFMQAGFAHETAMGLQALQWTVALTTVWSGLGYLSGKGARTMLKIKR